MTSAALRREGGDKRPSIAASSGALLVANIGAGIVAFLFAIIVARSLGPSARGVVAFSTTITVAVSWFSLVGLEVAFSYYCGAREDLRPAIVSSAIVAGISTGLVGAAVGWAILNAAPQLVPDGVTKSMLLLALFTTPLLSIQRLFNALLIGSGRIAAANYIVLTLPIVALLTFLAIGASFGRSATAAVVAWAISRLVGAVGSILLGGRAIGFGGLSETRHALSLSMRYGVRAYPGSIAQQPIRRLDTFVLAAVAPASQLGYYAAAVNMSEIGMYLPNAVASILLPRSAGMPERTAAATVHRASAVVLVLVACGSLVGIVLASPLVRWVLGDRFSGAIAPLQLMLVAMIGAAARRTFGAGLMARNRAGIVSLITLATMALIVGLDLALIPRFEAVGAALASTIAYCAGGVAAYITYRRLLQPETRASLPPLLHEFRAGVRDVKSTLRSRRAEVTSPRGPEIGLPEDLGGHQPDRPDPTEL